MEASAGPRVSWSQTQLVKLILSARKNESAAGWCFSLKGVNWLALCPGPLGPLGSRGVTVLLVPCVPGLEDGQGLGATGSPGRQV